MPGLPRRRRASRVSLREVGRFFARRTRELEGRPPVVREHLRVVFGAAEGHEPLGHPAMPGGALGSRQLSVRDVTHERVRECELELAGHRRASLASQEALSHQCVHDRLRVDARAAEGARPEDLSDDRSRVEVCLLVGGQAIEASADDALQRLGERQVLGGASLEVQLGELLGVEGVAAGAFEQGLLDVGRQHRAVEQGGHQPGGLDRRTAARARSSRH